MAARTKKIIVQVIFWMCILVAAAFALYPNLVTYKAKREKQELIAQLMQQMTENAEMAEKDRETAVNAVIELEENEEQDGEAADGEAAGGEAADAEAAEGEAADGELSGETGTVPDNGPSEEELARQREEQRQKEVSSILDEQTVIAIIEIEDIDILEPVVVGTSKENLKAAAGHVEGTAGIAEPGNCVICAHNGGIYGKLFRDLRKLKSGNTVVLTDAYNRSWTYEVYDSFIVEPQETWILEDLETEEGAEPEAILTLFTCENNGSLRRVVRCRLND